MCVNHSEPFYMYKSMGEQYKLAHSCTHRHKHTHSHIWMRQCIQHSFKAFGIRANTCLIFFKFPLFFYFSVHQDMEKEYRFCLCVIEFYNSHAIWPSSSVCVCVYTIIFERKFISSKIIKLRYWHTEIEWYLWTL